MAATRRAGVRSDGRTRRRRTVRGVRAPESLRFAAAFLGPGFAAASVGFRAAAASAICLAALLATPSAAPLHAQGLDWIPQAGIFMPLNDLARVEGEDGAVIVGRRESGFALGVGVELGARGPVALRGTLLFGPTAELPLEGSGCPGCQVRGNLLVVGGGVLVRPTPAFVLVRPYFLGGVAVKRYGLDDADLRSAGFRPLTTDPSRTAIQLGAGLEVRLGLVEAIVELSDYVSRFQPLHGDARLQNDVFFMVGLRL